VPVTAWSWEQVTSRRLERSHLLPRAAASDAVDVVRAVCGIQAQVPTAAELCVGVRTDGLTRARLRSLINEERLLTRTFAMRGTATLLPSDELPLYLAAMRELRGGEQRWFTSFGLDAEQARTLFDAVREILDRRRLSRQELVTALREQVGPWVFEVFDPLLSELAVAAAYAGVLAYGPGLGSRSTFVRADQWGGVWRDVTGDAALRELLRRYFATYGPATPTDLARWLGLRAGRASDLIRLMADELVPAEVEGRRAWVLATDAKQPGESGAATVRLLPQYDCYILGSGPIDRVAPLEVKDLLRRGKRGRYEGAAGLPVLVVGGVVAGLWERGQGKDGLHIKVEVLRQLTADEHGALELEAGRLARFDECSYSLTIEVAG